MKTVANLAWFLCLGFSAACATGSTVADGEETADAGGATSDTGPVVVVGTTSGAGGTATPPEGTGGTNGGFPNDGTGDDSGFGFGDDSGFGDGLGDDSGFGFGDDSGFGFGDDSGDGFGDDSGYGFGDDSGYGYGDDSGGGGTCEGYAYPDTLADCDCTASDPSECQANGCYNGYYCDTNDDKCKSTAPSGC